MTVNRTPPPKPQDPQILPRKVRDGAVTSAREARMKAALKANMARRKAQARARAAVDDTSGDADNKE